MEILKQIQQLIKGRVSTMDEVLGKFSKDASLYKLRPQAVVFPKDVEDLERLVSFVAANKAANPNLSLTVRAAGTDMSGGPLSESIVVSVMENLNHIKEIGKDYAVVEPGVYYRDFEKEVAKHGLLFPAFPASKDLCAMGGIVANNSGGELTLTYGKTERYVMEIKMILRDGKEYTFKPLNQKELQSKLSLKTLEGEVYRQIFELIDKNYDLLQAAKPKVSKNSAGYFLWNVYDKQAGIFDLTKLITGSEGTLGIITEAKLRLVKPKTHERLLVVMMNDLHQLPSITNHLLQFHPQSLESYDDHTFKVALKLLPDIVARLKGGIFKLLFGFIPELWMVLTGGIPKLVILAEFAADSDTEAVMLATKAQDSLHGMGLKTKLIPTEKAAEKYWIIRRESFNMLRHHVAGMRTAPFIDDFVVPPEKLGEVLPKLYAILDRYKLLYTIAGHVGDGNIHIIPLMKLGYPNADRVLKEISKEVYQIVFDYHGSTSGEHNDGLVRGPYLKQMYGDQVFQLFLQTKNIFDPAGIFNPGKKANATFEFGEKHLDF